MSRVEQELLDANMPRLKAQRRLDEIEADPTRIFSIGADELYDLALLATGSKEVANAYRVARVKANWKPT